MSYIRRVAAVVVADVGNWSIWLNFHALLQVPDFVNIKESKSACSSP